MAKFKLENGVAFASVVTGVAGVAAFLCFAPSASANGRGAEGDASKVVAVRIDAPSRMLGVKGSTKVRVVGVLAGGGTRVLNPGEATLHVTPPRAGRILANHTLYPRMEGHFSVHATVGSFTSKPTHFEAIPF